MAVDRWFFGGGAEHTPESARRLVYTATNGAEGVGGPTDLKVMPLPVPGGSVRIIIGSALILSRYIGGETQTYMGTVYEQEQLAIAQNDTQATRSDLVILRVRDPWAAGSTDELDPSEDPATAQYIWPEVVPGVPAGTTRVQTVPGWQNVSAVTLARIDLPKLTGTVHATHIKDLRQLSRAQEAKGDTIAYPTGATTAGRRIPDGPAYGDWPLVDAECPRVEVPLWANYIFVTAICEGVWYAKGNSSTEMAVGGTRVAFGGQYSENGIITARPTDAGDRRGFSIIGKVKIPDSQKGTTQRLSLQGVRTSSNQTGGWFADYQSCISLRWTFSQDPA